MAGTAGERTANSNNPTRLPASYTHHPPPTTHLSPSPSADSQAFSFSFSNIGHGYSTFRQRQRLTTASASCRGDWPNCIVVPRMLVLPYPTGLGDLSAYAATVFSTLLHSLYRPSHQETPSATKCHQDTPEPQRTELSPHITSQTGALTTPHHHTRLPSTPAHHQSPLGYLAAWPPLQSNQRTTT